MFWALINTFQSWDLDITIYQLQILDLHGCYLTSDKKKKTSVKILIFKI